MFFLTLNCTLEDKDVLIAELWEQGSTGIVESDEPAGLCRLRAYFGDAADPHALSAKFGGESEAADHRDWIELAREKLQPMLVGQHFFLVPEWRNDATPAGRFRIVVNAGLAFGTGAHETTRLCLELLEEHVRAGMTIVDVGTGSGILSEAAIHLGAGLVVACDVDETAVRVAAHNFARAGAHALAFAGSTGALRSEIADIITANLTPEWVMALASEWMRLLRPGGCAILSGFEAAELDAVTRVLEHAGARILAVRAEAEWRAIVARRN